MVEKIETVQTVNPNDAEDPYVGAPEGGLYLHDLPTDYDTALDDERARATRAEIHEDDMHEAPGAGFHTEGMYDEDSRSDGAHLNEADGTEYKTRTRETDLEIIEQSLGRVVTITELERDDPAADLDDETEEWLRKVEADPSALQAASAEWVKLHRR